MKSLEFKWMSIDFANLSFVYVFVCLFQAGEYKESLLHFKMFDT